MEENNHPRGCLNALALAWTAGWVEPGDKCSMMDAIINLSLAPTWTIVTMVNYHICIARATVYLGNIHPDMFPPGHLAPGM